MRNNGRYTASEELIALGGGDLIKLTDKCARHANIDFPGHKHATLYDVNIIEGEVRDHLKSLGINLHMESSVKDVDVENKKIKGILLSDDTYIKGDVFIETTGIYRTYGQLFKIW